MNDRVATVFTWVVAGIALVVGVTILFRSFLILREAFLSGLHGHKFIEPQPEVEPKMPLWREKLNDFGDRRESALLLVVVLALLSPFVLDAWSRHHRTITNFALLALMIAARLLDETTWRFWALVVARLVWLYGYRRNRRRQLSIIELLLEIRRKLG